MHVGVDASLSRIHRYADMRGYPMLSEGIIVYESLGQSTRSVLGKCVYLVTLVMSLFDLQDVCIAIGSLATLDLPMVVDLIGIYGLKGPYCTLTTTDWFLQALSVISRGSWGDVARRFTMIRWASPEL
ncbi:acyl-CoA dehydrogenase-related protein [Dorcoceras hygrometricum]|uniref:Acyl-CoA dehydrogenase-related protein n=1 Tax=Dorcoceras hygrometricum TaxID=472368 RepID=A0A2Z6ZW39_9LAMI|nr:acyl-CoA dehydrogenase-related protein [Dorcoceras hygrometricum]